MRDHLIAEFIAQHLLIEFALLVSDDERPDDENNPKIRERVTDLW
jgi:hypothetical protein